MIINRFADRMFLEILPPSGGVSDYLTQIQFPLPREFNVYDHGKTVALKWIYQLNEWAGTTTFALRWYVDTDQIQTYHEGSPCNATKWVAEFRKVHGKGPWVSDGNKTLPEDQLHTLWDMVQAKYS